jgi:hypothetical protein
MHSRSIRLQYRKGREEVRSLQKRLLELQNNLNKEYMCESELSVEDSENEEIPVIPDKYLMDETPYSCAIPDCNQHFHNYSELLEHASAHPSLSLCI